MQVHGAVVHFLFCESNEILSCFVKGAAQKTGINRRAVPKNLLVSGQSVFSGLQIF